MSESGLEQQYIKEAFDTNWVVPLGPNVTSFEKDLERFVGMDKRVAVLSSGTAAIHLALLHLNLKPEDEVLVQSFTFCASSNPVTYVGATPVFVDSEELTWNMDPDLLEEAIKDRIAKTGRTPKAIIPVTLYGMPYQIDRIMDIAERYGITIIEDTAEAMGSRFGGQMLGTFGQYGVLSFNGNKMITTSGGGALICPDDKDKQRTIWFATQARENYPYYQHEAIGYNYRMSNICAGIGRGQMTIIDEHIAHHRHVQALYEQILEGVEGINVHRQPADPRYESNFWLSTILLSPTLRIKGQNDTNTTLCEPNANVDALRVLLDQAGIESRPLWKPMHCQPIYQDCPAYVNGVSERLFSQGLCLPTGPCVTDEDVAYIVKNIKEAIVR
ncbi:MAG: aminotransferase class V-fold PLP-dependent enzyme [Bacteroidaceae bacterium]|nr:aminotransferase class V-fold PLP-dependent enzyme [Bacteroidaceae bacterium]